MSTTSRHSTAGTGAPPTEGAPAVGAYRELADRLTSAGVDLERVEERLRAQEV